jgi:hypothetical protein
LGAKIYCTIAILGWLLIILQETSIHSYGTHDTLCGQTVKQFQIQDRILTYVLKDEFGLIPICSNFSFSEFLIHALLIYQKNGT